MTAILHVIDRSTSETQLQLLGLLLSRGEASRFQHAVVSVDGHAVARAQRHLPCEVYRAERRLWGGLNWSPRLVAAAKRRDVRLLHAWGIEAAAACASRLPELSLVLTLPDPEAAGDSARWIRAFPTDAPVVVDSQSARNALISAGIAPELAVVFRGPVDFAAINRARQTELRATLVGDAKPVLLLHGPPTEQGGQYYGIWAAAVLKQVFRGLRVIMPYESAIGRRLERFAQQTRIAGLLTVPDAALSWPQLVACADVFVAPAEGDICTTPLAIAMGAGMPIVASAVRSVAELVTDRQTALLYKPDEPRRLADRLLHLIEDAPLQARLADACRAQAYRAFSSRAFLDGYARLYDNVLAGRPPADGIEDPLAAVAVPA